MDQHVMACKAMSVEGDRILTLRELVTDPEQPFISVVSPIYLAEDVLPTLCERLTQTLTAMAVNYEIILVCDGSPDNSWAVMERLVKQYANLVVVQLSRNFGQHYAMTAGLDLARGEWTVVIDCDLQEPPEEIPRLLAKAQEGFDIVLARRIRRKHKWWRRVTSVLFFKVFSVLSGYKLDSAVGSFRIMRRPVVDGYCSMRESYRMFAGLVEWLGFKTGHVDIEHAARFSGASSYNVRRLLQMALDGMISFSNRPLYISIVAGVLLSLASGLYGAWLIIHAIAFDASSVPGWASTMVSTSFLGGLILLNQGVLGIYVGHLYNQTKGRPLYVIQRILVHAPVDAR